MGALQRTGIGGRAASLGQVARDCCPLFPSVVQLLSHVQLLQPHGLQHARRQWFLISVLDKFNQALHFWSSSPRMELLVRWAPPRARLWQEMALSALVPKGGAGRQ